MSFLVLSCCLVRVLKGQQRQWTDCKYDQPGEYELVAVGGPATKSASAGNVFSFSKAAPVAAVQPTTTTGSPFTFGSAVPAVTQAAASPFQFNSKSSTPPADEVVVSGPALAAAWLLAGTGGPAKTSKRKRKAAAEDSGWMCQQCDFIAKNKSSLNIHRSK